MSVAAEVDALVEQAKAVESAIKAEVADLGAQVETAIAGIKENIDALKTSLDERIEGWRGDSTVDDEPALPVE